MHIREFLMVANKCAVFIFVAETTTNDISFCNRRYGSGTNDGGCS